VRLSRAESAALAGIVAAAAAMFFWRLGASSYFVDEVLSIQHALPGATELRHLVRTTESTPYLYFYGLHLWLYHGGSEAEASARASSAVAGVLFVAAAYWAALPLVGRRRALLAAGLAALSPLVLEYAQQVRVYVWVLLGAAIAIGGVVRGGRWLWVGCAACVALLWLHYTALLLVVPLAVLVATRRALSVATRAAFVGICVVAQAVITPLMVDQYRFSPNGGSLAGADLSLASVVRVVGTPFAGRGPVDVEWPLVVGALAVVAALALSAARGRWPVVAAAGVPLVALIGAGVLGKDILITRYSAVATPGILLAFAGLPRRAWVVWAAAAVAVAGGLVKAHGTSGRYPPAREVMTAIARDLRPGDLVVSPTAPGAAVPLAYYAQRTLHPVPPFIAPEAIPAQRRHPRLWVISETASRPADLRRAATSLLAPYGYRAVAARSFTTSTTFNLVLAVR
jgi:hypothetical protein